MSPKNGKGSAAHWALPYSAYGQYWFISFRCSL